MTATEMMNDYLDKKFNEWFNNSDIEPDNIDDLKTAFIAGFEEANRLNW